MEISNYWAREIKRIDNLSGYYQPTVSEAMNYLDLFRELGMDLNNTWVDLYEMQVDSMGNVEKLTKVYTKMLK